MKIRYKDRIRVNSPDCGLEGVHGNTGTVMCSPREFGFGPLKQVSSGCPHGISGERYVKVLLDKPYLDYQGIERSGSEALIALCCHECVLIKKYEKEQEHHEEPVGGIPPSEGDVDAPPKTDSIWNRFGGKPPFTPAGKQS